MISKLDIAHKIKKYGILSIVFTLLLITVIVAYILEIINIVKIGTTDWENDELNQSKNSYFIASLICIILLTPIVSGIISIVWANKCKNTLSVKVINK